MNPLYPELAYAPPSTRTTIMNSLSFTNIAPTNDRMITEAAALLRYAGVWDTLCETCLWQPETHDGQPVHNEGSALAVMLDHLVEPLHTPKDLRHAFVNALGHTRIQHVIERIGRRQLTHAGWLAWKRLLDWPLEPEDNNPALFTDGWTRPFAFDAAEPWQPGHIPPTYPDEHIAWGCDAHGHIYPVPL